MNGMGRRGKITKREYYTYLARLKRLELELEIKEHGRKRAGGRAAEGRPGEDERPKKRAPEPKRRDP